MSPFYHKSISRQQSYWASTKCQVPLSSQFLFPEYPDSSPLPASFFQMLSLPNICLLPITPVPHSRLRSAMGQYSRWASRHDSLLRQAFIQSEAQCFALHHGHSQFNGSSSLATAEHCTSPLRRGSFWVGGDGGSSARTQLDKQTPLRVRGSSSEEMDLRIVINPY